MRFQIRSIVITICLLVFSGPSFASVSDLQRNLEVITSGLSSDAGVYVFSLDKKQAIFSKNEDALLNPASATKLVTAAAALKYLGPDFKFHTKFYITNENDLYVYGEGDPSIIIEDMKAIAHGVLEKKVRNVRRILINDSFFNSYTSPGMEGRKEHYNSFTGALSLNFNRIKVRISPARKIGESAGVVADSGEGVSIPVVNRVKTVQKRGGAYITFEPPVDKTEDHFVVSGRMPAGVKTRAYELRVSLPPLYFAETLKALLEQNGCKVSGGIYKAPDIREATLIVDHESEPLSEILADMNKFSNNFIAEQLVKVLGARNYGAPGNTAKGIDVLKNYLKGIGIPLHKFTLVNGSGLTYDNRMSAEQLVRVIQDMYNNSKLWQPFEDSLSVAGKDGTLRRRHKRDGLCSKLKAKTGTLDNVRTIAGIVPSAGNEKIGFAVILNGAENIPESRKIQEKIAEVIAQFER